MSEHDPLIAATASSALSHWRSPAKGVEADVPSTLRTARANIDLFVGDSDPLVDEIAQATVGRPSVNAVQRESRLRRLPKGADCVKMSMLIHGTHAFPEKWWFPGGAFHSYIKNEVRSDVYDLSRHVLVVGAIQSKGPTSCCRAARRLALGQGLTAA
jgi:hypothetical protein